MRVGLLIVGMYGASASTLIAGYLGQRKNKSSFCLGSYWCSVAKDYPQPLYDIIIGGWDYRFKDLKTAVQENGILKLDPNLNYEADCLGAVIGPTDYAVRVEGKRPTHTSFKEAVKRVRKDISEFRAKYKLDKIIILNSSSPASCHPDSGEVWSSNKAYAHASVQEGADWVEFTPSDSITPRIIELSMKTGSRLAGRDGSTGQTILKLCLRDFLQSRGLRIDSWYSTNLIGNHDGLVLKHTDYNQTKLSDKLNVLPSRELGSQSHVVEIQFVPPAGDNKEAWDCVYFSGWLDTSMSFRLNWHGRDSFLAAPLMLDIIAGLIHAEQHSFPPGLVSELGVFFKKPLGYTTYSFESLLGAFRKFATCSANHVG